MGMPNLSLNGGGAGAYENLVIEDDPDLYVPDIGGPSPKNKGNGNSGGGTITHKGTVKTGIKSGLYPCANSKKNQAIYLENDSGEGVISSSTPVAPTGSFSVEFWTHNYLVGTSPGNGCVFMGMAKENVGPASEDLWCAVWANTAERLRLSFIDSTGTYVTASGSLAQLLTANDGNYLLHCVVTYDITTGDVEFYHNGWLLETIATGNTNGVKAITTEDVRWCVGDVPSAADSDVVAGAWGATSARIHDIAWYDRKLTTTEVRKHYWTGVNPCSDQHPLNYLIEDRTPTWWIPFNGNANDTDGVSPTTETSTAYVSGGLRGDTGYSQQAVDFSGDAAAQVVFDRDNIPASIVNTWWKTATEKRALIYLNYVASAPSGATHRILGTTDSSLNSGWDIFSSSSSPYNYSLRMRNSSTEEAVGMGNHSPYAAWRLYMLNYYQQATGSGLEFKDGEYATASITNGGNMVAESSNDFWFGWLTGATGTGYDGYLQHVAFFDEEFETPEMLDFYEAYRYNRSGLDNWLLTNYPPTYYYQMDQNSWSSLTNLLAAYDGTAGNATVTATISGTTGFFNDGMKAGLCNGVNGSALRSSAISLSDTDFTSMLWIKPGTVTAGNSVMGTWATTTATKVWKVSMEDDGGTVKWTLTFTDGSGTERTIVSTSNHPTNGTVAHIAVTYSATDGWALYVNGVAHGTYGTPGRQVGAGGIYMNRVNSGGTRGPHAYQRWAIIDGTALSAVDLTAYYGEADLA